MSWDKSLQCHRMQSISFECRVVLVVTGYMKIWVPPRSVQQNTRNRIHSATTWTTLHSARPWIHVCPRLNTLCAGNCISVHGDLQTSMRAFRAREGTSIKSHPNVVTREPEVESEDGGHQVRRLPHPRVPHKVPRKRLQRMEGGKHSNTWNALVDLFWCILLVHFCAQFFPW